MPYSIFIGDLKLNRGEMSKNRTHSHTFYEQKIGSNPDRNMKH